MYFILDNAKNQNSTWAK